MFLWAKRLTIAIRCKTRIRMRSVYGKNPVNSNTTVGSNAVHACGAMSTILYIYTHTYMGTTCIRILHYVYYICVRACVWLLCVDVRFTPKRVIHAVVERKKNKTKTKTNVQPDQTTPDSLPGARAINDNDSRSSVLRLLRHIYYICSQIVEFVPACIRTAYNVEDK
jgi:hypothetical protein